jgi:hypothetical protein
MADQCRNLAEEIAAGRLDKEELDALMERLERVRKASEGLDQIEARILAHGQAIADGVTAAAQIEKRNRLKNIIVENRLMELIDRADQMAGDPRLGLEAAMVGVNAPFEGAQRSVDKVAAGIMNRWGGGLLNDLKEGGLLAKFNSMKGDLERQVARALHDMNSPEPRGVEVSKDAMAIARIMKKYQDAAKARQNTAGAYIRDRAGYVVRQTHDNAKMSRDRDAWKNTIRDKLDFERMEVAPERIEDFLDSAYDAMVTGVRLVDEVSPVEKAFKGPGNLGKKISASRTLDFKDADAWLDYNEQYGTGDLRETFMSGLSSAARATALMDQFGTNPRAMLDRVRTKAKRKYRSDAKKVQSFDGGLVNLDHAMDEITGDVNIGATTRVARIMSAYRAVQTMAKLGGAWISAISDLAFMASARNYQGRSLLDAWGDAFNAPFEGLSGGDKRRMADLMGAGLEGQLGDFMSRFNAQDDIAGRTSKAMQMFFKLNLLGPWTDANKRGVTFAIARDMALEAASEFDALPADMQRMLTLYDIGAKEWAVLREAVKEGPDGRTYLMPGDVEDVRGAMFIGMTQAQQDRFRRKVMESYFGLLTSEADFAVPSPGARERAILRRGYRPGTSAGEAIRFITQFKSFGVVALTKVMGRQVYGQGANTLREQLARGAGANMGLINTVVMTTAMGYMVMQAKEVLKGREPRPADAKTLIAAMMQGGGLGIYGDFLFGEASRFGRGTLETAVGPGIGTVANAVDLLQRTRGVVTGGEEDLRGDYVRFAQGNLPFANLFYVKPALDYMLWYHMQETINPGYLRRMERRIERENNQQFWLPPSSVVATGGGFR